MQSTTLAAAIDDEVFVTDVLDDARYLLMRAIRFVVLMASEVSLVFVGLGIFRATVVCVLMYGQDTSNLIHPTSAYYTMISQHPVAGLIGGLMVFALLWMMIYAVGMPYRYETTKPGLNARRCHRCGIAIPDELSCPNCKAFRPARMASWSLHAMSGMLTVAFIIHDIATFLLGMHLLDRK